MVPRQKFENTSSCLISGSSIKKANACQPFTRRAAVDTLTQARQPWEACQRGGINDRTSFWMDFSMYSSGACLYMHACVLIPVVTCYSKPTKHGSLRLAYTHWWSESHSVLSDSATPRTVAHQAPLPTGFSRQQYWNGLPFPSPGELPDPGIEPGSPAL